ncbi:MAG TPA: J domain-containing protein [Myxococcota bacterium]|nr:J domain-containing protein [Myxococcota bacterium]
MSDLATQAPAASGSFKQISLAAFLHALYKRDATGELHVRHDGRQDVVYVRDGFPLAVTNDRVTVDVLGQILMELGLIDAAQHNQSLERLARGGARHGEVLLEMGVLDQAGLRQGLTVQLRRKLNRLFYIEDGSFAWYFGDHGRAVEVHTHPLQVIMQGVRSAYGAERLAGVDERLRRKAMKLLGGFAPYEPLYEFEEDERRAVRLLSSEAHGTLEAFEAASGLGPVRARGLVHVLDVTEVLDVRDAGSVVVAPYPTQEPPGPVAPPPPAPRGVPGREGGTPGGRPLPAAGVPPSAATPPASAPPASAPGTAPASGGRTPAAPGAAFRPPTAPPARPAVGMAAAAPRAGADAARTPLEELCARIVEKHATLAQANHFEALELATTATGAEVQEAFRGLAKRFHPDRLPRDLDEVRPLVEDVFRRLSEAHKILADDKEREAYRALLGSGGPKDRSDAARVLQAEEAYKQGEAALKRGAFAQAQREFAEALRLHPQEAEYRAAEAWAHFRAAAVPAEAPRLRREAMLAVQQALADRKDSESLNWMMGELLEGEGNPAAAVTHYRKVVAKNPHHIDAKRKVHLYERQKAAQAAKEAEQKKGGLFGSLFKKK